MKPETETKPEVRAQGKKRCAQDELDIDESEDEHKEKEEEEKKEEEKEEEKEKDSETTEMAVDETPQEQA